MNRHTDHDVAELLRSQAEQAEHASTVWTVATFGAVAEFHTGFGEHGIADFQPTGLSMTSEQGGVRVQYHPEMRAIAYEGLSRIPELWSQGISVCLPERTARMAARTVLTDMGVDDNPVIPGCNNHTFFDLGLAAPHMDACVRTGDAALAELLRLNCGRTLFAQCSDLVDALLIHSPTRIFKSALARVEVATPIPATQDETFHGAHTHILPDLLSSSRTHAATVPIPHGWLPVLNLFPANPVRDSLGNPVAFQPALHRSFQTIMEKFGDSGIVELKQSVIDAILAGKGPDALPMPTTRALRTALRVCLRQLRFTHGYSPTLHDWTEAFEVNRPRDENAEG